LNGTYAFNRSTVEGFNCSWVGVADDASYLYCYLGTWYLSIHDPSTGDSWIFQGPSVPSPLGNYVLIFNTDMVCGSHYGTGPDYCQHAFASVSSAATVVPCGPACNLDPIDGTRFSSDSKVHWGFFTAAQWLESDGQPGSGNANDLAGRYSYTHPYGYKAAAMVPRRPGWTAGNLITWQTFGVAEAIPDSLAVAAELVAGPQGVEIAYDNGVWKRRNSDSDPWHIIGPGDNSGTFVNGGIATTHASGQAIEFVNVVRNNNCGGDPGGVCVDVDANPTHLVSSTSRVICFAAVNTHNEAQDPSTGVWSFNGDTSAQDASSSAFVPGNLSSLFGTGTTWGGNAGVDYSDNYLSGGVTSSGSDGPFSISQDFSLSKFEQSGTTAFQSPADGSTWFTNFTRGALDAGSSVVVTPGAPDIGGPPNTREVTNWLKLVFIWNNNHCWTLT
jgi:hypothetical protein